ncbi:hypothetical protein DENIS_3179 [Desulfonema ishimotonii]|uniref:Methyltransferase FkbM domain-containing protein n=1 Tax=Desulfonema ishimotonii TaxID=45657 RepID=A0A401FZ31_9BACT|nr:FkbM family methyltransferase [Desulfonema ishimotonii]GBC62210.1 hypothetical protein DENIS_3179 [Desulfonema ishimotonii]
MNLKSSVYKFGTSLLKEFWRMKGGRDITVFGNRYRLDPDTIFPSYRRLPLPKGDCLSQIVRHGDFIQMHAVCRYVAGIDRPVILDVGAHHGAYAVVLGNLARQHKGKVIALEPNPESFEILKRNVRENNLEDTVFCEQAAVMDCPGEACIAFQGSQSFITPENRGERVQITTLAEVMHKYNESRADLLIIDVEGAELPVLKGFPWEKFRPGKIFCELHPYAWKDFGYKGEDMKAFVREHGFRCIDVYFQEYLSFDSDAYIGPVLFLPEPQEIIA